MRVFLAFTLGCVLLAGCGGGGSTSGTMPPGASGSTGTTGATTGTSAYRLLATSIGLIQWYNQSPLGLQGGLAFACPNGANYEVAFTPDFNRVYVEVQGSGANIVTNNVLELDGTNYSLRRAIPVGSVNTMSVAVTPDDSKLYVGFQQLPITSSSQDLIDVIDVGTGKITRTITLPTSSGSQWMTTDTAGHLYVVSDNANIGGSTLTRINTSDDTVKYSAKLPGFAVQLVGGIGVSFDRAAINLVTSNEQALTIDAASGKLIQTASITGFPIGFDESKTAAQFYVVTNTPPSFHLLTFDAHSLNVRTNVLLSKNYDALQFTLAAGSSGRVFIDEESPPAGFYIKALNPSTGAELDSIQAATTNLYAQ